MNPSSKIKLYRSDSKLSRVTFPLRLRDNNWADDIGSIQRELDKLASNENPVEFDLTKCRWIDPLPLLSLLIEIVRSAKRGIQIQVRFPSPDDGPEPDEKNTPYQKSPNRLLLFLAREGFFDELINHDITAYVGTERLDKSVVSNCALLPVTPSYADAQFIPLHLLDVPRLQPTHDGKTEHSDFAASSVEKLLEGAEVALHSRCSTQERRHLLYTLRAVLQEFLHNVQEHAYPEDDFCPAAIYVRYRQGGVKLVSGPGKDFYEECIKEEISSCAMISRDWLDAKPGCLEVFFLDRGIGIVQKFLGNRDSSSLAKVMRDTFFEGKSSKKTRTTEHGGLHLMHTLMKRSKDYLRALNDQAWFGSDVPFIRKHSTVVKPFKGASPEDGLIGLAYHLRLAWKAATDEEDTWLRFKPEEMDLIWKELSRNADSCKDLFAWYEKCAVVDERFDRNEMVSVANNSAVFLLWLPRRHLMKWDILDSLERIASYVGSECTLVIADIPSMEAAAYKAAMSQSDFNRREVWPAKFKRIVLATNRWTFAYAKHKSEENGSHGFTPFSIEEIPEKFKPGIGKSVANTSFRQLVMHWLKWHDSKRFWEEAQKGGRLFLSEKVIWSEDEQHRPSKVISGYLDFPSTTHNRLCAALYRNALSRIFGLLDERTCELIPVDRLADPVVHDVYANEVYDTPKQGEANLRKIAVGSVLVSGSTLSATGLSQESVHFFIHGDSTFQGSPPSLFHWMPVIKSTGDTPTQKRIGKTSAIAPEGWLSIEIPRFDNSEEPIGRRHPEQSYEDWQSSGPIIVKLGHWCYEGHHDFLTVNIPDAVEDAFARNGPLAQFLVNNILHHLGVSLSALGKKSAGFSSTPNSNPGILVYRSHPSSERIIDQVLGVLPDIARQEVMKWVFPVLPLRMRWGGSTLLIPPRMREEISAALQNRKNAIVFDDAAISGRTIQDLLTSLRTLGAMGIHVVTIANRLRLPAEAAQVKYFWRLDVPTMGRAGNCPLCQASDLAQSFAGKVVQSSEAHNDIQRWIQAWAPVSPLSKWDAGLDPLPLQERQIKKYCYRHSAKKYLCNIPIFRSTGLSIHAAEVHAMTASDDYGLKKIKEQSDPVIKIELAASQLLLFGDELDQDLAHDIVMNGLLTPLVNIPSDSPYGALAVLILMRTLSIWPKQVQRNLAVEVRKNVNALGVRRHGQVLIAFMLSEHLLDWTDDACYVGVRLLSTRHCDVAIKLRSLFRETVSAAGNVHSEPIPMLLKTIQSTLNPSSDLMWRALDSLAKLKELMNELGSDLAASDGTDGYADKRKALENSLVKAEEELKTILDKSVVVPGDFASIRACLEQLHGELNAVADCYFHRVSPDETRKGDSFKRVLGDIWENKIEWRVVCAEKKVTDTPIIRHSSDSGLGGSFGGARWIWIPWHKHLQMMVTDLLMNSIIPTKQIKDPWASSSDMANMWVHVIFNPQSVCISMANECENPREVFQKIVAGTKNKTTWDALKELGGTIELDDKKSTVDRLVVRICLPYAPYLSYRN